MPPPPPACALRCGCTGPKSSFRGLRRGGGPPGRPPGSGVGSKRPRRAPGPRSRTPAGPGRGRERNDPPDPGYCRPRRLQRPVSRASRSAAAAATPPSAGQSAATGPHGAPWRYSLTCCRHNTAAMKKVRVAVIGVGYLGRFHAQKYAQLPECELSAVVDSRPEARAAVAAEVGARALPDYRSLLGEVDSVSIVTPTA